MVQSDECVVCSFPKRGYRLLGDKTCTGTKGKVSGAQLSPRFLAQENLLLFLRTQNGLQALIPARKRKMVMLSNADKLARWMRVGLRAQLSPRFPLTEMWRERCTKLYSSTQSKSDFSRRNFARFNLRFQCEFVNGAPNIFLIAFSV
ncbi:hypothetical protein GG496_000087 [Candidatus Fervidibacteria bacterium JGI MDM2 JNZ-1-D12]